MILGFGLFLLVFGVDVGHFCGKVFLVLGKGFLIILRLDVNPSGILSAVDFGCNSFLTSVSGRDMGGSEFMIRVSGAVKVRV